MPTNNNINYGPAPLPGTAPEPVLGNNIDRAPAAVPLGAGTGINPTATRPVVPVRELPVEVTVATTNGVIPVTEQPVDVTGAEGREPNITATNQQRYITVLANGTVISTNVTSLNFLGTGVSVAKSGSTGSNITITGGGGGNANTGNIGFANVTMYSLSGLSVNNSDLSHGFTAGLTIPNNGSGNIDRKSTRLNSSHVALSRMPSSA